MTIAVDLGRKATKQTKQTKSMDIIMVGVAAFHSLIPMLVFGFLILNDNKLINTFTWVPFKK